MKIIGLILAGGQSRRFNGKDKAWQLLNGKPLIEYTIATMRAVTDDIIISANSNLPQYTELGLPVVKDSSGHFDGPLHGILSAMHYLYEHYEIETQDRLLIVPCDMPALDAQCLRRLVRLPSDSQAVLRVAHDGQRLQPLVASIPIHYISALQNWIDAGNRKVEDWIRSLTADIVNFEDQHHCFKNINQPGDLEEISRRIIPKSNTNTQLKSE